MRYLCLVYHDEKKLDALSQCEYDALVEETLAYDEEMRRSGHYLASNALEFVETATSLRVRGDTVSVADGPFAETKERLGGYILIEARDLNEAIRVASKIPPARMGGIEVRPVTAEIGIASGQQGNGKRQPRDRSGPDKGEEQHHGDKYLAAKRAVPFGRV